MKVITFNINGAGKNKDTKKENVKNLRDHYKPDLFLIQEAVEEQEKWLAPKGHFAKRGGADSMEGGYVVAGGTDVTGIAANTMTFFTPFSEKTYQALRPPLKIECKWKDICVQAYTWHAPFDWKGLGGSKMAATALRLFLKAELNNIYEAARGKFIWILAGDLNVEGTLLRMIMRKNLPDNLLPLARLKTSKGQAKSHALMFYGGEPKIQPNQLGDVPILNGQPSHSPHRWLVVRFPIEDMLRSDQKKITC